MSGALATDPPTSAAAAANGLGASYGSGTVARLNATIEAAQKEKAAKTAPVYDRMQRDVAKDQLNFDKVSDTYKPIEQTPPPKPPENDPLKAFGSIAGAFALLASGLSHTPAINAMNGMAAAINGAKTNDWKAYEAGYQQWKENTELAIQTHKSQADDMRLAMEKMQHDIAGGTALAHALAASTDDLVAARQLEAGNLENLAKLQQERARTGIAMQEAALRVQEMHVQLMEKQPLLKASGDLTKAMQSGDPEAIAKAREEYAFARNPGSAADRVGSTDWQMRTLVADNMAHGMTSAEAVVKAREDLAKAQGSAHPSVPAAKEADANTLATAAFTRQFGHPPGPGDEAAMAELRSRQRTGSGGVTAKQLDDVKADIAREHPDYTPGQLDTAANQALAASKKVVGASMTAFVSGHLADYEKTFTTQNGRPPTNEELGSQAAMLEGKQSLNANQFNTLEDRAQQFSLAMDQVQKIQELLPKAAAIATRLGVPLEKAEAIGNMLGTDSETDRADFENALAFLRVNAPLLLKQANPTSRAIGGDQEMVNKIIRGEQWGDSRLNVASAMNNLGNIFQQDLSIMQGQAKRSGRSLNLPSLAPPPGSPATPDAPAAPRSDAPWENDPVVAH